MGDSKRDFEVIDRSFEHHQIYPPMFTFSPTRSRPLFLRFRRRVNPPIYRLVGPQLNAQQIPRCNTPSTCPDSAYTQRA